MDANWSNKVHFSGMLPKRIQILSPQVANQIAAGEVVERPASIVKELLENALDAASSALVIEITAGGKKRIKIRDNGVGIHKDDLPKALLSHATSKILEAHDLFQITTMGFRGEALASIASVARTKVASRIEESQLGWQVAGDGAALKPVAHPVGTTVTVEDLFYNVPARRHFLKSEKNEWQHILKVIHSFALAHPALRIKVMHDGKEVFFCKEALDEEAILERMAKLLGVMPRTLQFFHDEATGIRLSGFLTFSSEAKGRHAVQCFLVNQRIVKDKLILHALKVITEKWLPADDSLIYVLSLEIEPELVDVNVHPTKHEVRFRESTWVHDFIVSVLEKVLAEKLKVPENESFAHFNDARAPLLKPVARVSQVKTRDLTLGQTSRYWFEEESETLRIINVEKALNEVYAFILAKGASLKGLPLLFPKPVPNPAWWQSQSARLKLAGIELECYDDVWCLVKMPAIAKWIDLDQWLSFFEKITEVASADLENYIQHAWVQSTKQEMTWRDLKASCDVDLSSCQVVLTEAVLP